MQASYVASREGSRRWLGDIFHQSHRVAVGSRTSWVDPDYCSLLKKTLVALLLHESSPYFCRRNYLRYLVKEHGWVPVLQMFVYVTRQSRMSGSGAYRSKRRRRCWRYWLQIIMIFDGIPWELPCDPVGSHLNFPRHLGASYASSHGNPWYPTASHGVVCGPVGSDLGYCKIYLNETSHMTSRGASHDSIHASSHASSHGVPWDPIRIHDAPSCLLYTSPSPRD